MFWLNTKAKESLELSSCACNALLHCMRIEQKLSCSIVIFVFKLKNVPATRDKLCSIATKYLLARTYFHNFYSDVISHSFFISVPLRKYRTTKYFAPGTSPHNFFLFEEKKSLWGTEIFLECCTACFTKKALVTP